MCEFCPTVGRCCVCEHVTAVDYRNLRVRDLHPPEHNLDPSSVEGFLVQYRDVIVRYDRHTDAIAVLSAIPSARLRN